MMMIITSTYDDDSNDINEEIMMRWDRRRDIYIYNVGVPVIKILQHLYYILLIIILALWLWWWDDYDYANSHCVNDWVLRYIVCVAQCCCVLCCLALSLFYYTLYFILFAFFFFHIVFLLSYQSVHDVVWLLFYGVIVFVVNDERGKARNTLLSWLIGSRKKITCMTIIICVPGEPLLILVRLLLVIGYGIMGSIAFRVLA